MSTKTVNLKDLAKELEAVTQNQIALLKQATALGVAKSIPDLVKASPVDTGLYAQSWEMQETEVAVLLGNYAPHSPMIEYGTRPFTPPIGPLLAWAKRVLQDPSQPPDYSSEVWGLAKGTQRKISEVGLKPKKVMENMIPSIIENIKREYLTLNG